MTRISSTESTSLRPSAFCRHPFGTDGTATPQLQRDRPAGVAERLMSRDVDQIIDSASRLLDRMMRDPIDRLEIREAVENFLRSDAFVKHLENAETGVDVEQEVTITETEDMDGGYPAPDEPSQGLKGLLYHIAHADAYRKAYEHRGIGCDECGESPLRGIRWHCMNCPDWDLCSTCEANTRHPQTHVFAR